jgi:hypothetical protein
VGGWVGVCGGGGVLGGSGGPAGRGCAGAYQVRRVRVEPARAGRGLVEVAWMAMQMARRMALFWRLSTRVALPRCLQAQGMVLFVYCLLYASSALVVLGEMLRRCKDWACALSSVLFGFEGLSEMVRKE